MKLGSRATCPVTGAKGFVTRFVGTTAICRADDGTTFRVNSTKRPNKGQAKPCHIYVHGIAQVFNGVTVPGSAGRLATITDPDPLWHGCDVSRDEGTIVVLRGEAVETEARA